MWSLSFFVKVLEWDELYAICEGNAAMMTAEDECSECLHLKKDLIDAKEALQSAEKALHNFEENDPDGEASRNMLDSIQHFICL